MRSLVPLVVALVLAGCRATSPASEGVIRTGDLVTSAVVTKLGEEGQYRTDITVVRHEDDGTRSTIAAPSVISRAGEEATVTIAFEGDRIDATILVPEPDRRADGVDVRVTITEDDAVRASPRLRLRVPD
jgi:hypothetical protein